YYLQRQPTRATLLPYTTLFRSKRSPTTTHSSAGTSNCWTSNFANNFDGLPITASTVRFVDTSNAAIIAPASTNPPSGVGQTKSGFVAIKCAPFFKARNATINFSYSNVVSKLTSIVSGSL